MRIESIYQQQRSATTNCSSSNTNNNMENTASNLAKGNRQKDIINYNLDHVYCSEDSGYRNADVKALRKENKQLQAMLLLHLDLIQEQSNQLIAKDKQLLQLKEENEALRLKCDRLDRRAKVTTRTSLPDHPSLVGRESLLIDKYKPNHVPKSVKNIIEEAVTLVPSNISASDIALARQNSAAAAALAADSQPDSENVVNNKHRVFENSVIGQNNGKLISKIILQRKHSVSGERIVVKTEYEDETAQLDTAVDSPMSSSDDSSPSSTTQQPSASSTDSSDSDHIDIKDNIPMLSQDSNQNHIQSADELDHETEPIPGITIKIEKDADETTYKAELISGKLSHEHKKLTRPPKRSFEAVSQPTEQSNRLTHYQQYQQEQQQQSYELQNLQPLQSTLSPSAASSSSSTVNTFNGIVVPTKRHCVRGAFMSTTKLYKTREWQIDEIEAEVNRQIAAEPCEETMHDSAHMNLEIPKWRTWEYSPNIYTSNIDEPMEDMSEDAFVRRHARFLNDERKRKKWDVQRIREQRTIERLKRRHCKEELTDQRDSEEIQSFFPEACNMKVIQITDDLPVAAFGECIPMLSTADFALPWHKHVWNPYPFDTVPSVTNSNAGSPTVNLDNSTAILYIAKKKLNRVRGPILSGNALAVPAIGLPYVAPSTVATNSPVKQRRTRQRQ